MHDYHSARHLGNPLGFPRPPSGIHPLSSRSSTTRHQAATPCDAHNGGKFMLKGATLGHGTKPWVLTRINKPQSKRCPGLQREYWHDLDKTRVLVGWWEAASC